MYHPMQGGEQFVINAINVGLAAMHKAPEEELKKYVLSFVQKYGFLGFMTALPTTADFGKEGVESGGSVTDREGNAIAMVMGNAPQAVAMGLQKKYAERYDWLVKEFTDWAFTFMTSFLYYLDYDSIDKDARNLYRQGISAFGGISPTYRIALEKDAPVIVWDFHSLLVMVQMCFSFILTDKDSDMRMCKHCKKAFIASRKGN